jgi:hypothetical protein
MRSVALDEEERLIEKLRKVEALFARATSPGERQAAASALDRIRQRLAELNRIEKPVEMRFSLADPWSKALFLALVRRYGLNPYRYAGQRRTTVTVKAPASFVDDVLWPEFQQLNATLRSHLDAVTNRIIQQAIHGGDARIDERPGQGPVSANERAG